jgi:hypothetical protein
MRKLATVATAAGAGLVLALIATTPLMAQNVHLKGSEAESPLGDNGGTQGHQTLVEFEGGIGVQPVSAGNGTALVAETVNRNIVRGVQPAVQPWRIADFTAEVKADGRITANGTGLVFAGGDTVGTALLITPPDPRTVGLNVFATLICENVAPFVERNTSAVPLAANGDFKIDNLRLEPPPPATCATPVLLIRNQGNLNWFSAGIQENPPPPTP